MANDKQNITIVVKARGIKEAQSQMRKLGGSTNKVTGGMGGMIAKIGGATVALLAMQRAITASVKEFSEFEQSMADVKAITGATGSEFLKLENSAKALGRSTKFSASAVSSLQKEYAKLGFTTSEIQDVQKATLDLASAVGAELADSAEVAGSTLRGFGMDAKDTATVTDTMALSFSRSALDMRKFSDSMTYVAPVAKMAGFEMQGTTAVLGTLANAGIDGSMAGTSLRSIFLQLSDSSSALSKRLGGSITSVDQLIPALEKLKKEGIGTEEMLKLVDKRSVSAFSVLMDGTDTLRDLSEQFNNAGGSAERMANIQLDTLEGKMTIMNSAMSGLQIAIGERLAPSIESAVEGFTSMFSAMTSVLEIPMSDKLREEASEVRSLATAVISNNNNLELRDSLLGDLMSKYPEYFGHLNQELATTEDIVNALQRYNEVTVNKIRAQRKQEELAELYEREADAMDNVEEAQLNAGKVLDKYVGKVIEGHKITTDASLSLEDQIKMVYKQMEILASDDSFQGRANSTVNAMWHLENQLDRVDNAQKRYSSTIGKTRPEIDRLVEGITNLERRADDAKNGVMQTVEEFNKISDMPFMLQFGGDEKAPDTKTEDSSSSDKTDSKNIKEKIKTYADWIKGLKEGYDAQQQELSWKKQLIDANAELAEKYNITLEAQKTMSEQWAESIEKNVEMVQPWQKAVGDVYNNLYELGRTSRNKQMKDEIEAVKNSTMSEKKKEEEIKSIRETFRKKDLDARKKMKPVKYAEATSSIALGVAKALQSSAPPLNMILAGITAGAGAIQLATIAKSEYGQGGLITGASHSQGGVDINAEGGEFVMSRNATEAIGVDALSAMNQGGGMPSINLSISAPLVDETVTESIVPALRSAIRRGELTSEDFPS